MTPSDNIFRRYYEKQEQDSLKPNDTVKDQVLSTYNLIARTVKLFDFFVGTMAHTIVGTLKLFSDVPRESPTNDELPTASNNDTKDNQ